MREEEIAARERGLQVPKKAKMRRWQRAVKGRLKLDNRLAACQGFSRHPVRDQGLQAAQTQPLIEQTAIAQTSDRDQFMVALEEYGFVRRPMFDQPIDRCARRWPAIDI